MDNLALTSDEVEFLMQLMDSFPLSGNRQQLEIVLTTMAAIRLKLAQISKKTVDVDST
jgi:nitroreductase